MKTTKTLEKNMTKFDDVKKKIQNLDDEKLPCDELREGVQELRKFIETYPFKKITRKTEGIITYFDFYTVKGYSKNGSKKGNEILGPKIGSISKHDYYENEFMIEQFRNKANKEKLQQLIEKLNKNKKEVK